MGQAQVPYAVATNIPTPGIINVDGLATTGAATVGGALSVSGGVNGGKTWLYQYLEPAGTKASSLDGRATATVAGATLTTGTVYAFAMPIENNVSFSNMTLVSLTAEATGTHAWVGVADSTGKVVSISADNTGAAYFAANTAVTTAVSPYTTTAAGLYYGFVCVVASGTMPTFAASAAFAHAAISTVPPIYCGSALTGQTVPVALGSSLGTITPTAGHALYAYLT